MYKSNCIIFDFDGVIVDSVNFKNNCFLETFKDHTTKFEAIRHYLNNNIGLKREIKIFQICTEILEVDDPDKIYKYYLNKFEQIFYKNFESIQLFSTIRKLLEKLRNLNFSLIILSSAPIQDITTILKKYNIDLYFEEIYETKKDKISTLESIINYKKLNKLTTFYIGDSIQDYEAATYNNIGYFHLNSGQKDLLDNTVIFLNDPSELLNYVVRDL